MGTRKGSFEIYRQFVQAPSKRLASPALGELGGPTGGKIRVGEKSGDRSRSTRGI